MLVSKCWRDSGHSSIVLAERVFWKSSPQPGLGYGTALATNTSERKCSSPTTLLAHLLGATGGLVSGESGDRQDTPHTETDRIDSRGSVSQGIHLSRAGKLFQRDTSAALHFPSSHFTFPCSSTLLGGWCYLSLSLPFLCTSTASFTYAFISGEA